MQYLLTSDGTSLAYMEAGTGTPVILIHGFPFDSTSWMPQFEELQKKYRVIVYDQRGFGRSEKGNTAVSIKLLATDLSDVMDALALQEAILCGLSMGGYVLLNFISRYAPKVKALVLCDTQCRADTPEAKQARADSQQLIRSGGKEQFIQRFVSKLFTEATFSGKPDLVNTISGIVRETDDAVIISTLQALAERDNTCDAPGKLSCPILLMGGKEDIITPLELLEEIKTLCPAASLQLIPDAGHLSNLEQPEAFNKALLGFFKNVK